MPAGVEVTGKNGAIPDPEGDALARAHVLTSSLSCWAYTPRSRNWEYFSMAKACAQRSQMVERSEASKMEKSLVL